MMSNFLSWEKLILVLPVTALYFFTRVYFDLLLLVTGVQYITEPWSETHD